MPTIKMLSTREGSVDGHSLQTYHGGQVYSLHGAGGEDLALVFIREGWAELQGENMPDTPPGPEQNAAAPPPQSPAVPVKPQRSPAGGKR